MAENVRICSGGFLVESNRFLFGKRSSDDKMYPSVWDILGGHAEGSESSEEALKRELEEELNALDLASTGYLRMTDLWLERKASIQSSHRENWKNE
jgi:8-oxo-dGTP pyrophosphatase MutT (NUDIX family)